jgi:hypothetical protein
LKKPPYSRSVFINCPFTDDYAPIFRGLVFAVVDCGFVPRSALAIVDGGEIRLQKIERLIEESKFGIHDLSNMSLDPNSNLPRFNMPFELGIFLGAKRFGSPAQKKKRCLILDSAPYRYQQALSDIAGQDIKSHQGDPVEAIRCVRAFLRAASDRDDLPGAQHIIGRYQKYETDLPAICKPLRLDPDDLDFNDLWATVAEWEKVNAELAFR